jgi:hypothetical protein
MKKAEMEIIIKIFLKWLSREDYGHSNEEVKLREYYGVNKSGSDRLITFFSGYKQAKKETEKVIAKAQKDGLTCGIAYTVGILRRFHDSQSAKFIINESGLKSIAELRAAGCDQLDIDNIGDLLPEGADHD